MSKGLKLFVLAGLLVTVGLAVFLSPWADSNPDGLNRAAIDNGFADQAERHALADAPIAGYSVKGVENERMSTALSGLIGVTVTFGAAAAFFFLRARRKGSTRASQADNRGRF